MNYALLLFPDFSLILCGYLLCRFTALDRGVWDKVEALVYYFLFPVLLFHSIVRSPLDLGAASGLIQGGLLVGAAGVGLSYLLPHLPWLGARIDRRDAAASAQVAFRFNSFIALALAERLGGAEGLQMIAVLIGICVPAFNIAAVWPMARHGGQGLLRSIVRNPLIVATTAGLALNLVGAGVPGWLRFTLALTVPLLLVFSQAAALVYWHRVTPAKSLFFSLVAGLRTAGAFVVFLLGWCVVFVATGMAVGVVATLLALVLGGGSSASALLTVGLVAGSMLVIASMFFTSIYPAYIACFGPPPDDTASTPHQPG